MGAKSKIFYDGNCVVCDMEISHYIRIAPDDFELVDINDETFSASTYGWTKKDVDRELHVMTPDGEVKIGLDAFAHIWERIPRYHPMAKMVRWPFLHGAAKIGYRAFTIARPYLPKKN